jgi:hypothetical protein
MGSAGGPQICWGPSGELKYARRPGLLLVLKCLELLNVLKCAVDLLRRLARDLLGVLKHAGSHLHFARVLNFSQFLSILSLLIQLIRNILIKCCIQLVNARF